MWLTFLFILLGLFAVALVIASLGRVFWHRRNRRFRRLLLDNRKAPARAVFDPACLEALPAPVQRYFLAVLRPGQPLVRTVRIRQRGQMHLDARSNWKPFRASQLVVADPPGFDWDARIGMAPGLTVCVQDAYARGGGCLRASLWGLITVAKMGGTAAAARGELMRFLAETPWYPTVLLPGQGVTWAAVDDQTARATLSDAGNSICLDFSFDAEGLIVAVYAPGRPRLVAGKELATPWRGTFSHYEDRNGIRVPTRAEVAWLLPEGPDPYWRGSLIEVTHE